MQGIQRPNIFLIHLLPWKHDVTIDIQKNGSYKLSGKSHHFRWLIFIIEVEEGGTWRQMGDKLY